MVELTQKMSLLTSTSNITMACRSVIVLNNTLIVQRRISLLTWSDVSLNDLIIVNAAECSYSLRIIHLFHFSGFCLHSLLVETGP